LSREQWTLNEGHKKGKCAKFSSKRIYFPEPFSPKTPPTAISVLCRSCKYYEKEPGTKVENIIVNKFTATNQKKENKLKAFGQPRRIRDILRTKI